MRLTRSMFVRSALAGLGLAGLSIPARAELLDDVKAAKKLRVAIDLGSPPFGSTDGQMNATGSDVDTARLLAQDLGVELEIVQTTGANRIPFLQTSKADLVISSLSVTPEREKVIDFSVPYAQIESVMYAPKAVPIASMADVKGKRIATTRGTTNDKLMTDAHSGAEIVRFDDDATLVTAIASGQVDTFVTSPALLKAVVTKAPKLEFEKKFVVKAFPLGIGMRKGEAKLMAWVNDWIKANTGNGKLAEIYRKYHG